MVSGFDDVKEVEILAKIARHTDLAKYFEENKAFGDIPNLKEEIIELLKYEAEELEKSLQKPQNNTEQLKTGLSKSNEKLLQLDKEIEKIRNDLEYTNNNVQSQIDQVNKDLKETSYNKEILIQQCDVLKSEENIISKKIEAAQTKKEELEELQNSLNDEKLEQNYYNSKKIEAIIQTPNEIYIDDVPTDAQDIYSKTLELFKKDGYVAKEFVSDNLENYGIESNQVEEFAVILTNHLTQKAIEYYQEKIAVLDQKIHDEKKLWASQDDQIIELEQKIEQAEKDISQKEQDIRTYKAILQENIDFAKTKNMGIEADKHQVKSQILQINQQIIAEQQAAGAYEEQLKEINQKAFYNVQLKLYEEFNALNEELQNLYTKLQDKKIVEEKTEAKIQKAEYDPATTIQSAYRSYQDQKKKALEETEAADLKRYLELQKESFSEVEDNLAEIWNHNPGDKFSENADFIGADDSNFDALSQQFKYEDIASQFSQHTSQTASVNKDKAQLDQASASKHSSITENNKNTGIASESKNDSDGKTVFQEVIEHINLSPSEKIKSNTTVKQNVEESYNLASLQKDINKEFDNRATFKRAAKTTDDLPYPDNKTLDAFYPDEENNTQTNQIIQNIPKTLTAIFPNQSSQQIAKIVEHGLANTSTKLAKIVITKKTYRMLQGLIQQPSIQDILKHNSPEVNKSLQTIADYLNKQSAQDLLLTKEFPNFSEIQELLQNTLSLAQYSLADDKQKLTMLHNRQKIKQFPGLLKIAQAIQPAITKKQKEIYTGPAVHSVGIMTEDQQSSSKTWLTKVSLAAQHQTIFDKYATKEAEKRYDQQYVEYKDDKQLNKINKLASWGARSFKENISKEEYKDKTYTTERQNVIKKTAVEIKENAIKGKEAPGLITFPLANNINLIFTTDKDGYKTFNLNDLIRTQADASIAIPTKNKKSHDIIEIRNGKIQSLVFSHVGESQLAANMKEQLKQAKNKELSK